MSGKNDDTDGELSAGTLVTIHGLESDAGKALNGASGIVLGPPSDAETKDAKRYPVLLYAVVSKEEAEAEDAINEAPATPPLKRSIKGANLINKADQKCQTFNDACNDQASIAYSNGDIHGALFWLGAYYERWPEDYRMSLTYANLLREYEPKEAWAILRNTVPNMEPSNPIYNNACYDMCITCLAAGGKPEVALEWAEKISADDPDLKQLKVEALDAVMRHGSGIGNRNMDIDGGDGPILEVHRRAAAAIQELKPDDGVCMSNYGAALCMVGNNREGVRWYRRAMASGHIHGESLDQLKKDLALAMMQCPGGPMEQYRVIGVVGNQWGCVHKASIGQYELYTQRSGDGSFDGGLLATGPEEVEIATFPIPDIDDEELFANVDLPPPDE